MAVLVVALTLFVALIVEPHRQCICIYISTTYVNCTHLLQILTASIVAVTSKLLTGGIYSASAVDNTRLTFS